MTPYVVDTNVAIAANGRGTHADRRCRLTCVEKLESVVAREIVAIDDGHAILNEYRRHLRPSGMPGVGDMFYKHILNHQYRDDRVRMVEVTPSDDDRRGFDVLPENAFDPSDRKFLAVAVVARAVVLNATDSDWDEHDRLLDALGVEVSQLCPQHASKGRGEHDE
ncbi:hypothetical protein [Candidatus Palauibacter sp.]|uniref:hypothetical protein n=1 Tax=Candidatus Palauibacter sp. TaxID=3101350 RepID=UPI003AF2877A